MDQTKIGKLIAKLRKEKGMTQRELGDKVGVGFKAVSKWERGITCPDISIINELSKILGITSDELLTGELNKEHNINSNTNKKQFNKRILFIIPIIFTIGIIIFSINMINKHKTNAYRIVNINNEYYIDGSVLFKDKEITIFINRLKFIDKDFNKNIIKNYEYGLFIEDTNIISYGYITEINLLSSNMSIKDFCSNFNISHSDMINIEEKKQIIKKGLILKITFLDINDNIIEKYIPIILKKYKK